MFGVFCPCQWVCCFVLAQHYLFGYEPSGAHKRLFPSSMRPQDHGMHGITRKRIGWARLAQLSTGDRSSADNSFVSVFIQCILWFLLGGGIGVGDRLPTED
jgi:hypothetical protein